MSSVSSYMHTWRRRGGGGEGKGEGKRRGENERLLVLGLCSALSVYHCHATAMPDSCLPSVQSAVAGENDEFSGKNQEVVL